jgi:hypothetical protein
MKGAALLIRLYPRAWRDRYGEEVGQLLADLDGADLGDTAPRGRMLVDLARGALDAHWQRRFGMSRISADPAVRTGVVGGLVVAALAAVVVVLTNVVFPGGPDESDSDPEYLWQYLVALAVLAMLLVVIGARAGRRVGRADLLVRALSGVRAGAVAGALIGAAITVIFLVVNNVFLDVVSRQHDKRVAFAASGWTSMRAYLSVTQLEGGLVLVPALAVVGSLLGLVGAALVPRGVARIDRSQSSW